MEALEKISEEINEIKNILEDGMTSGTFVAHAPERVVDPKEVKAPESSK